MNTSNEKPSRRENLLIFLCWFAYFSSYLGRYSYSASIQPICDAFGVTKADTGLVATCFFFSYGIGQVVHSMLCRRYNFRYVCALSLAIGSALNLAIGFGLPFFVYKYAFIVNGFAQAALWPSIITVFSRSLGKQGLKAGMKAMSTPVSIGTLTVYGISALCLLFDAYRLTFLISGFTLAFTAVLWFVSFDRITPDKTDCPAPEAQPDSDKGSRKSGRKEVLGTVIMLFFFAVFVNILKDGMQTWLPSMLDETFGLGDSLSLVLTLMLPICGVLGSLAAIRIHSLIPNFTAQLGVYFALSAVLLGAVLPLLNTSLYVLVVICFAAVMFLSHGANNILTNVAPLSLRNQVDSGKLAGIIDGFCYVGSSISTYGLGAIADSFEWTGVSISLLIVAALPVLIAATYLATNRLKAKRRSAAPSPETSKDE